jgi:protocatechuate 3,4-dioxygenase beta subunit
MKSRLPSPPALAALVLLAGAGAVAPAPAASLTVESLTPASCAAGVTPAQTEGPYFKQGSPAVTTLVSPGLAGTKIALTGWVLGPGCAPLANAVIDLWEADDAGRYDNSGYTLRGHVSTDARGRYLVETIIPGVYPGRTRHIHVKIAAPGRPVLTTQLYFPEDAARNKADGIYDLRLLVEWLDEPAHRTARFDFVLK